MRLSEAILLGSAVVHPRAGGLRFAGTNTACATKRPVVHALSARMLEGRLSVRSVLDFRPIVRSF